MKSRTPSKPIRFLFIRVIILVLAAMLQDVVAKTVTSEKDGIVLNVTFTKDGEKNLASCILTNRSEFPICTVSISYRQAFYAKLTDANGSELYHNAEWAADYGQKTSREYQRPRSHMGFQVDPGESVKLKFYLEDAYPESSLEKADKLEISWESQYGGAKNDLDGNPYRFPLFWTTSVSVPLAEVGIGIVPKDAAGGKELAGKESGKSPPDESAEPVSSDKQTIGSDQPVAEGENQWWWLLTLPVVMGTWTAYMKLCKSRDGRNGRGQADNKKP